MKVWKSSGLYHDVHLLADAYTFPIHIVLFLFLPGTSCKIKASLNILGKSSGCKHHFLGKLRYIWVDLKYVHQGYGHPASAAGVECGHPCTDRIVQLVLVLIDNAYIVGAVLVINLLSYAIQGDDNTP